MKVIVIGGGWSGCAAALTARKAGAEVEIYEKTDLLLGLGNVGGIMRNNGRYTAAEELINLGAGDLIHITDSCARHRNMDFPRHKHAWPYDVNKVEPEVRRHLLSLGVDINLIARVSNVKLEGSRITGLVLSDGSEVDGDVFIDATGSAGPMDNCTKYGNGCVLCILRCPAFGPRVSISAKCGIKDLYSEREDGTPGAFSGSCEIAKESLPEHIVKELDERGVAIIKVPAEGLNMGKLKVKVCQQYALDEFAENIVLIDTGHIKLMSPFYPLDKLRKIPEFRDARFMDPYAGGKGNSVRYLAAAPRTNDMRVVGVDNLFCCGEKSGFFIGHTEAMSTGSLAGHNAARFLAGKELLVLPHETAIGDIIAYSNLKLAEPEGRKTRLTYSGAEYFKRMQESGLYSSDNDEIRKRIEGLGLRDVFRQKFI